MKQSDLAEFEEKIKEVSAQSNSIKGDIKRLRNTLRDNSPVPSKGTCEAKDSIKEQPKNRILSCSDKLANINSNLTDISNVIDELKSIIG